MKNIKSYLKITGVLILGIFIGWLFFKGETKVPTGKSTDISEKQASSIWTCSMHPQIKQSSPGKCPLCAMDLVPLETGTGDNIGINRIQISESAMKIADVQTTLVQKAVPEKEIRLSGKVKADERRISVVTSRFHGRIEKLFVNFTGQQVQEGEKLATLYSPGLISAQKELFEMIKLKQSNPDFYKLARNKLKLLSLSDTQIDGIEKKGELQYYFDILSPLKGTVMKRMAAVGDMVEEGMIILELIDLSTVWVLFEAYESDLPWIHAGDLINFEVQANPGKKFQSKITFIDPMVDHIMRVIFIRSEITNAGFYLKPEMFVKGVIKSRISSAINALIIPKSAVLWTGKKSVVYVKVKESEKPVFEYREVNLGMESGNFYVIAGGLEEGEEIVTNGVFKIDAAAQLAGKTSMMTAPEYNRLSVPEMFQIQFVNFLKQYFLLKNALVESNYNKAKIAGEKMTNLFIMLVNEGKNLNSETKVQWMEKEKTLSQNLEKFLKSNDVNTQREQFSLLSNLMQEIIENYDFSHETIFIDFCPMAFEDKGATWISEFSEIKNPYFGDEMLNCGEIRKRITGGK